MELKRFFVYLVGAIFVLPLFGNFLSFNLNGGSNNAPQSSGNPLFTGAFAADLLLTGNDLLENVSMGDNESKKVVFVFSDFECSYCSAINGFENGGSSSLRGQYGQWQPSMPYLKMLAEQGFIRLVFKQLPLPSNAFAQKSAEASLCAAEQGKFWEYHDILFSNQNKLGLLSLKKYAVDLGLNQTMFNTCLDTSKYVSNIQKDLEHARSLGVQGTPTLVIDGKLLSGTASSDYLQQLLN